MFSFYTVGRIQMLLTTRRVFCARSQQTVGTLESEKRSDGKYRYYGFVNYLCD